jgi:hypothetical protein
MFRKNVIPKSQLPENREYLMHYPHNMDDKHRIWKENYIQVVSIDPSTKNLGFRIEKRFHDGTFETVAYVCHGFIKTAKERKKEGLPKLDKPNKVEITPTLYRDVINFLNIYRNEYLKSHVVIIEQQLPENYKAVRIGQCVIDYFLLTLMDAPLLPMIIEIHSKAKLHHLGAPKGLSAKDNKDWLIQQAVLILESRKDYASRDALIGGKKGTAAKKDDLADVVCQIEAFCKIVGWNMTELKEENRRFELITPQYHKNKLTYEKIDGDLESKVSDIIQKPKAKKAPATKKVAIAKAPATKKVISKDLKLKPTKVIDENPEEDKAVDEKPPAKPKVLVLKKVQKD